MVFRKFSTTITNNLYANKVNCVKKNIATKIPRSFVSHSVRLNKFSQKLFNIFISLLNLIKSWHARKSSLCEHLFRWNCWKFLRVTKGNEWSRSHERMKSKETNFPVVVMSRKLKSVDLNVTLHAGLKKSVCTGFCGNKWYQSDERKCVLLCVLLLYRYILNKHFISYC